MHNRHHETKVLEEYPSPICSVYFAAAAVPHRLRNAAGSQNRLPSAALTQDLVDKWASDVEIPDTTAEDAAIAKLKNFVSQAGQPTQADLETRAGAIVAMRTALAELLMQAATNDVSLSDAQALILPTQRNALRNAFGLLAEQSPFNPIASLLSAKDITQISGDLDQARQGIQARNTAKDILDTVITVAVVASQIAVKVATA